ncbi:hypothetical protein [Streptomyces sp. CAU 1734]|uniref:hypothetical protein n=1 Tax=Streptomyces sp. CAU 1734 TaxID=3140360 RepID=UPI0032617638
MTFRFEQPPARLTGYHLPYLLAAEAEDLPYDHVRFRSHGVPNNAVGLQMCGLLAGGESGLVLTDLGRTMLADWRSSPEGQAWAASWSDEAISESEQDSVSAALGASPIPEQMDLFADVRNEVSHAHPA